MSINRLFFLLLRTVLLACLLCLPSYAINSRLVETPEYAVDFFSTNKNLDNGYKALIRVRLKDPWKIFARYEGEEDFLLSLDNKSSSLVSGIEVKWPKPILSKEKGGYIYEEQLDIPILINTVLDKEIPFKFDLFLVSCDEVCIGKDYSFTVNLPFVDNDNISYRAIQEASYGTAILAHSIYIVLFFSFIGGFILNFMPCVLPVISLKVLSVVKARSLVKAARPHFIATSMGIITCFLVIGVIISLFKFAGQHVGLGFNFQYPVFVVTIVLLIMVFASILNDSIYLDLPTGWKTLLTQYSDETKILGSFLSGVFATILATPCTAPFLGSAISVAMTLSISEMVFSFIIMGTGMAFPFIMLSVFPSAVKIIPSPGPWLLKFKKVLEVLLYLTALWLIWIISTQLGFYPALALFLSCLLFKFLLEKRKSISGYTKILLILTVLSIAYAVPIKTSILEHKQEQRIDEVWESFYSEKISQYVNSGQVVLVDITADWCMTCKYNKIAALENPVVLKFIKKHKVVAMRGDYTNRNKKISDFLASYSRYGIPFTLVYSEKYPRGLVLPTILKPSDIINAVNKVK